MLKTVTALLAVLLLGAAVMACGDDDDFSALQQQDRDQTQQSDGSGGGQQSNAGSSGAPVGPAAMNTIQIGDQVWSRTLPMTTGQCFVYEDDGSLPTSGTVWGTLDNDDSLHFNVSYNQDGTFEAQVDNDTDMYWVAGARNSTVNDLTIELDFDALTITGSGTFTNFSAPNETAQGSFAFQCEPEE